MKPTVYLINTAQGGIVDTAALVEALGENRIASAALDVFEYEPPEGGSALRGLDNVWLSCHVAGSTGDARRVVGLMAADNGIQGLRGQIPTAALNRESLSGVTAQFLGSMAGPLKI